MDFIDQNTLKTIENDTVDGLDYQIPVTQLAKKRHLSLTPICCLRDFTRFHVTLR